MGAREPKGQEGEWQRVEGRRRNQKDSIASFFFTHFPENYNERSMWGVFQRWGRVVDIFMPSKRNKEG